MAGGSSPPEHLAREELRTKVQAVLAALGEGDREVLVLRYLERLCTREVAAILGLTVNGVKSRLARALERFTRLFGEYSAGGAR